MRKPKRKSSRRFFILMRVIRWQQLRKIAAAMTESNADSYSTNICATSPSPRQTRPGVRKRLLHLRHYRQSGPLPRFTPPPYSHTGTPRLHHRARLRHAAGNRRGGVSRRLRSTAWNAAADLYEQIYRDLPWEAQYVVPFAYKIRWYMKMNLREAVHMCELRTMPQGHPDYRFICQEMWR